MKSKNIDLEDLPEFLCEHFRHLGCDVHPFLVQITTVLYCLEFQTQTCIYNQKIVVVVVLRLSFFTSGLSHVWSSASVYYFDMSVSEAMIHPDAMK